jgi:8-oxo-dGTP diphosphatase
VDGNDFDFDFDFGRLRLQRERRPEVEVEVEVEALRGAVASAGQVPYPSRTPSTETIHRMLIRVVACIIEREGRLLVCERPAGKRHGGLWEFPGGKLEEGETPLAAARRELGEELGMEVTRVGEAEFAMVDPGSRFRIEFVPAEADGEPRALEHPRVAWLAEVDLETVPLAPSDREYVRFRLRRNR